MSFDIVKTRSLMGRSAVAAQISKLFFHKHLFLFLEESYRKCKNRKNIVEMEINRRIILAI